MPLNTQSNPVSAAKKKERKKKRKKGRKKVTVVVSVLKSNWETLFLKLYCPKIPSCFLGILNCLSHMHS